MVLDIHKLIAAINPDVYCVRKSPEEKEIYKKVKELSKVGKFSEAAEIAKPVESSFLDPDDVETFTAIEAKALDNPVEKHVLEYDSPGENLEPIYFWILDYLRNNKYPNVEKIVDNFNSATGSGHFSEMGMKATKMQEEAMKMLGNANTVIKSIINILYDLKEFKIRLEVYKKAKSSDINEKRDGTISLKQIWMDTVDAKRGNTGLKAMSVQYQYVTLIDAFMVSESSDKVMAMDLNDRVKRIVESRLKEFEQWMIESEKELEKRFKIEKIYLKSQVNAVQLYARWIKPYLAASKALEQRQIGNTETALNADIVTNFATTVFELMLLAEGEYKIIEDVGRGDLPEIFLEPSKNKRKYAPYMVIEYKFRTIPGKIQGQNYSFRGKVDLVVTSYALNKDEVFILKKEIRKSDFGDLTSYIEGATKESLDEIQKEISEYLDDKPKEEEKKEDKKSDDVNPFAALATMFTPSFWGVEKKKDEKVDLSKGIPPDNSWEKIIRSQASIKGRQECGKFYGEFKRSQNMVG